MAENAPLGKGADLPGWEGEELFLLESPAVRTWVAPFHGGGVVAHAIAAPGGWRQVLHAGSGSGTRARPTRFGSPVLFPFPGLTRDAAYWWEGRRYRLPVSAPDGRSFAHGFAHDRGWRVVERNERRIVMRFETPGCLNDGERQGYPFAVSLRHEVSLEEDGLRIVLLARNEGAYPAPVGLGLHPYFAMSFLGGERFGLVVETPVISVDGQTTEPVCLSAAGQELHTRTGLLSPARARMSGSTGEVSLYLDRGVSDLAVFAPGDGRSVSLEPTSCPLSAGSLLTDHDSPSHIALRLAPGDGRRMVIRIAASSLEPMESPRR